MIRAAPNEPMSTVVEPDVIGSAVTGNAGPIACAHVARSVTRAAGRPWISTLGAPGGWIVPPAPTGAVSASVTRAAGRPCAPIYAPGESRLAMRTRVHGVVAGRAMVSSAE